MGRLFVTSDIHLGHANIIKYAHRPFKDVDEMNTTIINNWNATVRPDDVVYILGDVGFGTKDWLSLLNGRHIWIKGNHDKPDSWCLQGGLLRKYNLAIELVHDPCDALQSSDLVLHGHIHMPHAVKITTDGYSSCIKYNVNTELHNYKPVLLRAILKEVGLLRTN